MEQKKSKNLKNTQTDETIPKYFSGAIPVKPLLILVTAVIIQVVLIQTAILFWLYLLLLVFSIWFVPKIFAGAKDKNTDKSLPVEPDRGIEFNLKSVIFLVLCAYIIFSAVIFNKRLDKFPVIMQFIIIAAGFIAILLDRERIIEPKRYPGIFLDITALVILIGLTAFSRFYAIGRIFPGVNSDEVLLSETALNIVNGIFKPSVFVGGTDQAASAGYYVLSVFYRFFGVNTAILRVPTALFSILSVASFYLFLRLFFKTETAFFSSAIFASNHVYLHISRWMHIQTLTPFFIWAGFGLAVYGFVKRSRLSLAFAGAVAGWSLYFYNANKIFVLLLAVYIVYELLRAKKEKRYDSAREISSYLSVFLICFVLALIPLIMYVITNTRAYFSYVAAITANGTAEIIKNIGSYLGMLTVKGTQSTWLNYPDRPVFSNIESAFFLLGAGIALATVKSRVSFIAVLLFLGGLLPGIFSHYGLPPSTQRAIIALSAAFLVITIAINFLMNIGTGFKQLAAKVIMAFAVLAACMSGIDTYFSKMANDPDISLGFSPIEYKINGICRENSDKYDMYLSKYFEGGWRGVPFMGGSIYFYKRKKPEFFAKQQFPIESLLMFPYGQKDVILILDSFYKDAFSFFKKRFPNAEMTIYNGRKWQTNEVSENMVMWILCPYYYDTGIDIITYKVPESDIREMAGLRFYDNSGKQQDGMFDFDAQSGRNIPVAGAFRGGIRIFENGTYIFKFENFRNPSLKINGKRIRLIGGISDEIKLYASIYNIDIKADSVTGKEKIYIKGPGNDDFIPVQYGRFVKEIRQNGLKGIYSQYVKGEGAPIIREDITSTIYDRWLLEDMEGRKWGQGFETYLICEWSGRIKTNKEGEYKFGITGGGQDAQIFIDGKQVYSTYFIDDSLQGWYKPNVQEPEGKKILLKKGFHNIRIRVNQHTIALYMASYIIMPDGKRITPIPEEMLYQ